MSNLTTNVFRRGPNYQDHERREHFATTSFASSSYNNCLNNDNEEIHNLKSENHSLRMNLVDMDSTLKKLQILVEKNNAELNLVRYDIDHIRKSERAESKIAEINSKKKLHLKLDLDHLHHFLQSEYDPFLLQLLRNHCPELHNMRLI